MERLVKYPWLPIPSDRGAVSICCATGKPLLDRVLLRATVLLMYPPTAKWILIHGDKSRLAKVVFALGFALALFVALLVEFSYVTIDAIGGITMRTLFWTISLLMLFAPSVLLLRYPAMYNPLTAFLLSFGLFALAAWASHLQTEASAVKSANQRWLPQAESACDRLVNLCYTIKRFQQAIACSCEDLREHVAQLDDLENLPIKLFVRQQCEKFGKQIPRCCQSPRKRVCRLGAIYSPELPGR